MSEKISLLGYSDKLSGRPGDVIAIKVSSHLDQPYEARLVRVISADPNPDGPGMIEEDVAADFAGRYPSRSQPFHPGSCARIKRPLPLAGVPAPALTLEAIVWPTLVNGVEQVVLAAGEMVLMLLGDGSLGGRLGPHRFSTGVPLKTRHWYRVRFSYDPGKKQVTLCQVATGPNGDLGEPVSRSAGASHDLGDVAAVSIAADVADGRATRHFNGKIEAPTIYTASEPDEAAVAARWDFSIGISTTRVEDVGPSDLHGELVNLPARGMIGALWDDSEQCWRHAPEHYAAIHFHEDDIYDFGWEDDFSFTIPDDLPSGVYAVRLQAGEHGDAIPLFVCPPKGERRADLCVLVSTFTYMVYGNHARPDFSPSWKDEFRRWNAYPHNPAEHREYGLSTYNYHSDGSGICHASHRRPLFNLRPGYVTFGYGPGSRHRHFQADSHLLAWLHRKGYAFDIVTDQELHDDGIDAIRGYKALTTGSHPEYHTKETLDALQSYRDGGGKLTYLGGNGFYWRVALHQSEPGAIEIRRAESGIRAWAAEPGEYYNAFDGAYGGLWRRNGRPPQRLAGVGFSAQGQFEGSYYRRKVSADDPEVGWILRGIEDEILGDFGLSGGGAAGFELDRADPRLGTPDNVRILASSEGHGESFVLVPEEQLTHITNWPNQPLQDLLRADMIYFDVPGGGGAVFATGSITFCGSLPWNDFDNNISTLLGNVLDRFLGRGQVGSA
ncbi:MAG: N,N-dimethylformamidase large subunit [Alphaproteobacteria bacterium]|nr:N,N-dimethylformamidase large subunit [Alphaproteobacteria bacterium]